MYISKVVHTGPHTDPFTLALYFAFARSSVSQFCLGHEVLWPFASLRCLDPNKGVSVNYSFLPRCFIFLLIDKGGGVCVCVCVGEEKVLTCQLISCAGALMSHVLQWMQLLCQTR